MLPVNHCKILGSLKNELLLKSADMTAYEFYGRIPFDRSVARKKASPRENHRRISCQLGETILG